MPGIDERPVTDTRRTGGRDPHLGHAVLAGVVTSLVGFTSSFAVVLAGLVAVGASQAQAASGIVAMCLVMGVLGSVLSWRRRQPVILAWSTPGAAMLAGMAGGHLRFSQAVGAFVVCGLLLALTGLVRPLERAIRRVPAPLTQAMLAGVLLPLCIAPVTAAAHRPAVILPVVLAWLLVRVLAPRWAVPSAVVAALVVMVVTGALSGMALGQLAPSLNVVGPRLGLASFTAVALPLYLVTMTSQNLPGLGIMQGFGYELDMREALVSTGLGSVVSGLFGGHAINLAAISAALAAGDEAHPRRDRRWVAGVASGVSYVVLALGAAAVILAAGRAPEGLLESVAGLALLATFASAARSALADDTWREAAALALLVGASGLTIAGIGAAFWSLVLGAVMGVVTGAIPVRHPRP